MHRPEGVPAERGPGPLQRQHRGVQGIGFDDDGRGTRTRSADDRRARIRTSPRSSVNVGGGPAAAAAPNTGRIVIELKPRVGAHADRSIESSPSCGRSWRQVPGIRVFMVNPPPINIGGRQATSAVPVHAAGHRHRGAVSLRRRCSKTKLRELPGLEDVNSDLQLNEPAGQRRHRPRPDRRARPDGRTRSRPRSTTPTARGRSRTIYAPNNQYQVILQVAPEFQRDPAALSHAVRAVVERAAGPARRGRDGRRPASGR